MTYEFIKHENKQKNTDQKQISEKSFPFPEYFVAFLLCYDA